MKNFFIFLSGMITMLCIIFLIGIFSQVSSYLGLTIFEEKGACITSNSLKIFQTLEPDMALAEFGVSPNEVIILLVNDKGKTYYDNQKISIPKGQCARQIGSYKYTTKGGTAKTVPVVNIE